MPSDPTRLEPAIIDVDAHGCARSARYDDIYHPAEGAIGQARHVFLEGNGLPERWAGRRRYTILETGFGLGLNFLATWDELRSDPRGPQRLHFVSVEAHPCTAADLAHAHGGWPELGELSRALIAAWPPLVPGFHRLHLDAGRVTLTLLFGDAATQLAELDAVADAIFLDGFSPDRNPAMWSDALVAQVGRLAAPDATAASWTVAVGVRAKLGTIGFQVGKVSGYGYKREMLVARRSGPRPSEATNPRHAVIVGAGLAGTSCAERLAARGWQIDLVERHSGPAVEGSGNRCGVLRPVLNLPDNANARLARAAFLYAVRHVRALGLPPESWGDTGVLHVAPSAAEAGRMARIGERHAFAPEYVCDVTADRASVLAGHRVAGPGWWFPRGAWADPRAVCNGNLESGGERIVRHFDRSALRIDGENGQWRVSGSGGREIACAPVVILANAFDVRTLLPGLPVPLARVRGQISYLPALPGRRLDAVVCGDGYVAPLPGGGYCVGATFDAGDDDLALRAADHAQNLDRIERLLPGFAPALDRNALPGRVAHRTTTPDRLPACGPASPNQPGAWVFTGLGARGLIWAPLCAEALASRLDDEPLPFERSLMTAIDPGRSPRPRISGKRRSSAPGS
jgi:tRNA 5-methylaminomethyl-2-thiouridine biosynthesis bifunctional protein